MNSGNKKAGRLEQEVKYPSKQIQASQTKQVRQLKTKKATKAAFFILAVLGIATMWMAVLADVGATLVVIANGLRLASTQRHSAIETS